MQRRPRESVIATKNNGRGRGRQAAQNEEKNGYSKSNRRDRRPGIKGIC